MSVISKSSSTSRITSTSESVLSSSVFSSTESHPLENSTNPFNNALTNSKLGSFLESKSLPRIVEDRNKVKEKKVRTPIIKSRSSKRSEDYESDNESSYSDFYGNLIEIGPPGILKYNSRILEENLQSVSMSRFTDDSVASMSSNFFKRDLNDYLSGGIKCEFCQCNTMPWPNADINFTPKYFCCQDYRDYIKGIMDYNAYRETLNKNITIDNFRSKKYIEKMKKNKKLLEKKIREIKRLERALSQPAYSSPAYLKRLTKMSKTNKKTITTEKDKPQPEGKQPQLASNSDGRATIVSIKSVEERIVRNKINYILSNKKYIDQGWTMIYRISDTEVLKEDMSTIEEERSPSGFDALVPMQFSRIFVKKFKEGNIFEIILADNTGQVYYPNGKLAITLIGKDDFRMFTAFSDDDRNPVILAYFDSKGNAHCNYPNGKLRYQINCFGAINFDEESNIVKRWLWPPDNKTNMFHPHMFRLNDYMSVKIICRFKIIFYFRSKQSTCKFSVGSRTMHPNPKESMYNHFRSITTDEICLKIKRKADSVLKNIEAALTKKKEETSVKSNFKQELDLKLPEIGRKNDSRNTARSQLNHSSLISTERETESSETSKSTKRSSISFSLQNVKPDTFYD